MALRNIRYEPDAILRKKSRLVTEFDQKTQDLIDDMLDVMYDSGGVGLAAVQVGVLKQILVMDISEDGDEPVILINPRVLGHEGTQQGEEACLSIPNFKGLVERPYATEVEAFDRFGNKIQERFTEMLAIVLNHELDHLEGILYTDKALQISRVEDDDE